MQEPPNQELNVPPETDRGAPAEAVTESPRANSVLFNERGLRAGWRFVLWLVLAYLFVSLLLSILRPLRRSLPVDIRGDAAQLCIVLGIFAATGVLARIERRSFWSYGFHDRRWIRDFWLGALTGWLSLSLMLLGMRAAHDFYFGQLFMHGRVLLGAAVLDALSFLFAVALFEEVTFRSYPLYTLADGIGFWPAAVIMSLFFALAHIHNPGEAKVGIIAVFAFGMMLAFSLWRTGALFWAIGFHFMWDYSETFLYGVPDSGYVSPEHLLSAKITGPAWITGGSVGPEGSWFIFLVLAAIAIAIHFAFPQRKFEISSSRR